MQKGQNHLPCHFTYCININSWNLLMNLSWITIQCKSLFGPCVPPRYSKRRQSYPISPHLLLLLRNSSSSRRTFSLSGSMWDVYLTLQPAPCPLCPPPWRGRTTLHRGRDSSAVWRRDSLTRWWTPHSPRPAELLCTSLSPLLCGAPYYSDSTTGCCHSHYKGSSLCWCTKMQDISWHWMIVSSVCFCASGSKLW